MSRPPVHQAPPTSAYTARRRLKAFGLPLLALLKDTIAKWRADPIFRFGAALGYYTGFSILPLLVLTMMAAGAIVGQERADDYLIVQLTDLLGSQSAEALRDIVAHWHEAAETWFGFIVTITTLLFAATGAFDQVQDALNTIWGVQPKERRGWLLKARQRFFSFMGLLGTAFLLLISMTLTATLAGLTPSLAHHLPLPEVAIRIGTQVVSFGMLSLLFAMIFKMLPRARVAWGDVWIGAFVTAALFMLGKQAIIIYLGYTLLLTLYGPAGILVIVLLWSFFTAQILLFGAEFTAVYASEYGSHVLPKPDADAVADPAKRDTRRAQQGREGGAARSRHDVAS